MSSPGSGRGLAIMGVVAAAVVGGMVFVGAALRLRRPSAGFASPPAASQAADPAVSDARLNEVLRQAREGDSGSGAPPLSAESLFAKACPAVVRVNVHDAGLRYRGHGSGFFVTADGLVVTNFHVINEAKFATVETADGVTLFVEGVAAVNEKADLALLKVTAKDMPTLPLAADEPPPVGTHVYAIGHPRGLRNVLSEGLISGHGEGLDGVLPALQTTAPISPGSSGGPLVTADGKVVGVTTAALYESQNLNFAVPVSSVHRLLEQQQKHPAKLRPLASAGVASLDKKSTDGLQRVWELLDRGQVSEAVRQLNELRATNQQNAFFWSAYGFLHLSLKNWDLAAEAFSTAVRLKPNLAAAHLNLGFVYVQQNKVTEAVREFELAAKLDPKDPKAYADAGLAYMEMKQPDRAVKFFKYAANLEPKNTRHLHDLARAYADMKQTADAVVVLEKAAKIEPRNAEHPTLTGFLLLVSSRPEDARRALQKAIALQPDHAPAYLYLGMTCYDLHDLPAAQAAWQNAARFDPRGRIGKWAQACLARSAPAPAPPQ